MPDLSTITSPPASTPIPPTPILDLSTITNPPAPMPISDFSIITTSPPPPVIPPAASPPWELPDVSLDNELW